MLDIRFLESLVCVVDEGSIAAAARVQMITPAAISQRIQALERELGCKLLSRAGHKVKPTHACCNLLPRSRRLILESQALIGDINDDGLTGTLKIGVISTALTGMIPKALRNIKCSMPNAKLHIVPGTSLGLFHALQNDEVDAAIIVKPPSKIPKSLKYWTLRKEYLVLISPKDCKGTVEDILLEFPYIRYDPLCWGGLLAEKYLQDSGINKESIFDLDSLEAITLLVAESVGVSIVPAWSGLDLSRLNISATIIEIDKYQREIVLVSPYHPQKPKLLDIFLTQLQH